MGLTGRSVSVPVALSALVNQSRVNATKRTSYLNVNTSRRRFMASQATRDGSSQRWHHSRRGYLRNNNHDT